MRRIFLRPRKDDALDSMADDMRLVLHYAEHAVGVETQALLSGQERGTALVYHVIAVNKADEGKPSNIVTTVL